VLLRILPFYRQLGSEQSSHAAHELITPANSNGSARHPNAERYSTVAPSDSDVEDAVPSKPLVICTAARECKSDDADVWDVHIAVT